MSPSLEMPYSVVTSFRPAIRRVSAGPRGMIAEDILGRTFVIGEVWRLCTQCDRLAVKSENQRACFRSPGSARRWWRLLNVERRMRRVHQTWPAAVAQ